MYISTHSTLEARPRTVSFNLDRPGHQSINLAKLVYERWNWVVYKHSMWKELHVVTIGLLQSSPNITSVWKEKKVVWHLHTIRDMHFCLPRSMLPTWWPAMKGIGDHPGTQLGMKFKLKSISRREQGHVEATRSLLEHKYLKIYPPKATSAIHHEIMEQESIQNSSNF